MTLRLLQSSLHRRYKILFVYFFFLIPFTLLPLTLPLESKMYFRLWELFEPALWCFEVLLVLELCGMVLERYRGLYRLGRWSMYLSLVVALAISLISLLPRIHTSVPRRSRLLFYTLAADRAVNLTLAVFLILMLVFVSRYPVALSKNVVLNVLMFTVFFLGNTAASTLHVVFDLRLSAAIDATAMAIALICQIAWIIALKPHGEAAHFEALKFSPEYQRRAILLLDSLNATALRVARGRT